MTVKLTNFVNDDRKIIEKLGNFSVMEHSRDLSVAPGNAMDKYFMSQMGVRRRQLVVDLDGKSSLVTQAGAMQWLFGNVNATTGVKGVGDLFGKMVKGAVTKESAIKPEYVGAGRIVTESQPVPACLPPWPAMKASSTCACGARGLWPWKAMCLLPN